MALKIKYSIFIVLFLFPASLCLGAGKVSRLSEIIECRSSFMGSVPELWSPLKMVVSGGHLVAYEDDGSFKIYDLPSSGAATAHIQEQLTFSSRKHVDVRSMVPLPDGFLYFGQDLSMNRVSYRGESLSEDIPSEGLLGPMNGIMPFKDGYLYLEPLFDGYDYLDCRTGKSTVFCKNPPWEDGVEGSNYILRSSSAAVHPEGGLVAVFYTFHDKVIYYDSEGRVIKDMSLRLGGNQDDRWRGTPCFYKDIAACNEKFIVASYGKDEYHFFDWEGNLLRRVRLDRSLSPVAFDLSSNTFYGIDRSENPMRMYSARVGFSSGNAVSYKTGAGRIMKR